jgi:hypothetical protein
MRTPRVEQLYRRLSRQVAELPQDRREALGHFMTEQDREAILWQCDLGTTLRDHVLWLTDSGITTIGALAAMAGVNPAPLYRWFHHGADLKLSTVSRLCQVMELRTTAHESTAGSRWTVDAQGHPRLADRTPLALAAQPPAAQPPTKPKQPKLKVVRVKTRKKGTSK